MKRKSAFIKLGFFCLNYNTLLENGIKYQQSIKELKQIAKSRKWGNNQFKEVLSHFEDFIIILTDPMQRISYTSNGFE